MSKSGVCKKILPHGLIRGVHVRPRFESWIFFFTSPTLTSGSFVAPSATNFSLIHANCTNDKISTFLIERQSSKRPFVLFCSVLKRLWLRLRSLKATRPIRKENYQLFISDHKVFYSNAHLSWHVSVSCLKYVYVLEIQARALNDFQK